MPAMGRRSPNIQHHKSNHGGKKASDDEMLSNPRGTGPWKVTIDEPLSQTIPGGGGGVQNEYEYD